MNDRITEERKRGLVKLFLDVVASDVLTNGDAIDIIDVLNNACHRAKADITEGILTALINGSDMGDPTPGADG